MNETLLMLVLVYVFFLAVLILLLLNSRLNMWFKCGLLIASCIFYFFSYQGWKQSQGWSAQVTLPDKFLLHYAVIEEPDKKSNNKGSIYLWLTDLANDEPADQPRSYRIDYHQKTHVEVAKAIKKIKGGNIQLGIKLKKNKKGKYQAKKANSIGNNELVLEFVNLPDPALPEK